MATRFKITQSKEDIIATGGIAMVGALLKDNRGLARVDKMTTDRIKKGWISNSGIIKSVVGLFTLARTDFADIELFRDELAFRLALELERVPSEETLRQRLDLIAKLNSRQTLLDYAMRDLLRKVESFGTVKIGKHKLIPLDIDVAALLNPGCKKEGIARTYHQIDGYAPIFAYLGSEGYMLANELRIGSQHSECCSGAKIILSSPAARP